MIRKQTKLWTTKDERKIRICDMSDSHLNNTIKMLKKVAHHKTSEAIDIGYRALGSLQGEMAVDSVEGELMYLETYGMDPSEITLLYDNMNLEKERRKIVNEKNLLNEQFYVAGVKFHKLYEVIDELKEEDIVQLVPEPSNKYDKFAVRIEALGTMVGYVPAIYSQLTSEAIASGKVLQATILEVNPDAEPWNALNVIVQEVEKDE